ncbi:MAG: nuclear transport factor 2 family protein [Gammaproteobacteria bacterium]|nr:MAG: nuclear transport factor 2 family protein [Gammaproteobacteria bacterium]
MDHRLQQMLDHHEIRTVLSEYCHGCDRLDQVRMASVYLDGSWDDHGVHKMPGSAFAEVATSSLLKDSNMCVHHLGQSLIRIDGDEAGADTYFIAVLRRTVEDGQEILDQMGGRFVDRFRRHNGKWKISHRTCVREWSISHPVQQDWLIGMPFVNGERSGRDPSFLVLNIKHSGIPVHSASHEA